MPSTAKKVSESAVEAIDLEKLLKLRLVVARFGEMDPAAWWNTKGVLGSLGKAVLSRGFPQTQPYPNDHGQREIDQSFSLNSRRAEAGYNRL